MCVDRGEYSIIQLRTFGTAVGGVVLANQILVCKFRFLGEKEERTERGI